MSVDLSTMIAPDSDQLDAVDLLSGPRTFAIEKVSGGNAEQPINIKLAEFPRPWRPGKSMRRVLVAAWGPDGNSYVGRRVKLYCDTAVQFGGQKVGGTRIAALSHITKPQTVPLLVSRGKSATFTVAPLPDDEPTSAPAVSDDTLAELVGMFRRKGVPEDKWLAGVMHYAGGSASSLDAITEEQARKVLAELKKRPDPEGE